MILSYDKVMNHTQL